MQYTSQTVFKYIYIYLYIISSGALSFLTFKPYIISCPPILLLTCSRAMTASKATCLCQVFKHHIYIVFKRQVQSI